jgi:hypothetical protein
MIDISTQKSTNLQLYTTCGTETQIIRPLHSSDSGVSNMLSKVALAPTKSLFFKKKVVDTTSLTKGTRRRTHTTQSSRSASLLSASSSSTSSFGSCSTIEDAESVSSIRMNSIATGSCSAIVGPKRSCLKGSRKASCSTLPSDKDTKKAGVRFGKRFSSFTQVYFVKSYLDNPDDLWWSRCELDACRKAQIDFSATSDETKQAVKTFLDSYQTMRQEFYSSLSTSENKNGKNKGQQQKLQFSSDQYYNIAKGYAYGFNGLEKLVGFDTEERRQRNKEVIQKTVLYYRQNGTANEVSVMNYCKALTAKDRYWARATGNAAGVAAH